LYVLAVIGALLLIVLAIFASYFFLKRPEFIVYSYTIILFTQIQSKIPNYFIVSNGLLVFAYFLSITIILQFFGKVKKYSFKYVWLIYFSFSLLLIMRIFFNDVNFFNQTNSLIFIFIFYTHVFKSFINSNEKFVHLLHTIVVVQLMIILGVFYNIIFDTSSLAQYGDTFRASALGLNVNVVATMLGLFIPVIIYLKKKYLGYKNVELILKGILILSIISMFLTLSRSGFVFLVFLIIYYFGNSIKKFFIISFSVCVFSYYIFFISDLPSKYYSIYRFSTIFVFEKNSRTFIWGPYLKVINENKLSGRLLIDDVKRFLDSEDLENYKASHNSYLGLAFNYGIPFMILYFLPLIFSLMIKQNDMSFKNMINAMVFIILLRSVVNHDYITLSFILPILLAIKSNELYYKNNYLFNNS